MAKGSFFLFAKHTTLIMKGADTYDEETIQYFGDWR